MHRLTNPSARPTLEALEARDVPSWLAAEFPGHGVWLSASSWQGGGWQQLTTNNASLVATNSAGDVVVQLPGQGVWNFTPWGTWQQLTANNATGLASAFGRHYFQGGQEEISYIVAEFPGQGLWEYTVHGGIWSSYDRWQQLTANNASTEAVDGNGYVVAEFPGQGVWYYGLSGWTQLTAANATSLAMASTLTPVWHWPGPVLSYEIGPPVVAAAFAGYGVWRIGLDNAGVGTWSQLTASDATMVGINRAGAVVGEFPGWGVWTFSDAGTGGYGPGWNQLTAADAAMVGIDGNGNVYGQFGVDGVWYDQVGSWNLLTASNASSFGVGG
jgi:hypothetical protein